uniref:ATP synthase F0 subunit 8 n=1 Tax=Amblyomma geoemydae TaxID=1325863 RepID=A0A5P8FTJ9_9ACAR|nr:ATP synthase F0 subunit 8 [Amblyomma geoemydae]
MPQLFPMNWLILTIIFLIFMVVMTIHIYFFKVEFKFLIKKFKKNNKIFMFKW